LVSIGCRAAVSKAVAGVRLHSPADVLRIFAAVVLVDDALDREREGAACPVIDDLLSNRPNLDTNLSELPSNKFRKCLVAIESGEAMDEYEIKRVIRGKGLVHHLPKLWALGVVP